MSEKMTQIQEAAAFNGLALNEMFPLEERYRNALKALELYEAAVMALETELRRYAPRDNHWAMPDWMRRYAGAIQHDGSVRRNDDVVAYVESKVNDLHCDVFIEGSPGHSEAEAIWKQIQVLQALRDFGSLREDV